MAHRFHANHALPVSRAVLLFQISASPAPMDTFPPPLAQCASPVVTARRHRAPTTTLRAILMVACLLVLFPIAPTPSLRQLMILSLSIPSLLFISLGNPGGEMIYAGEYRDQLFYINFCTTSHSNDVCTNQVVCKHPCISADALISS